MNKYQLYKQIRQELAAGCDNELRAVNEILETGVSAIAGGDATLHVAVADSVNSMSDAGRIFRDELNEAVRLILDRYRRNLQKEIATLGLDDIRPMGSGADAQRRSAAPSNGDLHRQLRQAVSANGSSHPHESA